MTIEADMTPTADCQGRVVVTGAGGFIGHHLVTYLKYRGYWVRGVDQKMPEYERTRGRRVPARGPAAMADCFAATRDVDEVYALAADMGGMGFISSHHAEILHNNPLISIAHAGGGAPERRQALLVHVVGMRVPGVPAARRGCHAAEGTGRLSGAAPGRIRLGEADRRAAVHCTIPRTTASRRGSCASTTSSDPSGRGTAAGRRRRPPCAARSPPRS